MDDVDADEAWAAAAAASEAEEWWMICECGDRWGCGDCEGDNFESLLEGEVADEISNFAFGVEGDFVELGLAGVNVGEPDGDCNDMVILVAAISVSCACITVCANFGSIALTISIELYNNCTIDGRLSSSTCKQSRIICGMGGG